MQSGFKLLLSILLIILLNSCFAVQNFSKNGSSVQGHSSSDIFLNPQILAKKEIYINFRNSTIYDELELEDEIKQRFIQKGFKINENPNNSPITMQANLKYYGVFEKDILNAMLEDKTKKDALSGTNSFQDFDKPKESKYGIDFFAFAIGGALSFAIFNTIYSAIGGAILIGGLSIFLENMFESKMIVATVDVEVSEAAEKAIKTYDFRQVQAGEGGVRKSEFESQTNFKTYKTKILVVVKRKSLNEKNALPDAKRQIIASVVGII